MKRFTRLVVVVIFWMTLGSCMRNEKRIVRSEDYQTLMTLTGYKSSLEKCNDDLSFWKIRFEKDQRNITALVKMASLHASRFKLTGNVDEILISDSLYTTALKLDTHNAGIYRSLATNAISRHEFWQGKSYIKNAISIGENKAASLYILTDIMLELGNIDSAKIILNDFTNRNSFAWLIRQAKVLDHEGDLNTSISLMEKASNLVKGNDELFCWSTSNLGDMYGHAGRIEESYRAYLEVLRRKPDYHYALKGIAWIAFSNDHNSLESERMITYLMQNKNSPDHYLMLSDLEEFRLNNSKAKQYAEAFKEKVSSPNYGNMYNSHLIGMDAVGSTRPENIIDLAKKEISVRPTPESYSLLAWALYNGNRSNEAIKISEDYVEGKTYEPEVLYRVGMMYKNTGKIKARLYLKTALESSFELGPVKEKELIATLRDL